MYVVAGIAAVFVVLGLYTKAIQGVYHLFFSPRFQAHRLGGLIYLCQWVTAFVWYWRDYESFSNSHLIWTLPLNGVLQAISASYYFTFLPKKADPGYYNDKYSLSYSFVVENIFFSSLLFFQWTYYSHWLRAYIPYPVEVFFVFLPYLARPLFPKTRFRDSLKLKGSNASAQYANFYFYATYATKAFYIWAKHYIGFYLNYIRFLDRASAEQQYRVYLMLIFSCWATTIAMFTHTLAVKYYISRPTSYALYMGSLSFTLFSWYAMRDIFYGNWDLFAITLVGLLINFKSLKVQYVYQAMLAVLFVTQRAGYHQYLSH